MIVIAMLAAASIPVLLLAAVIERITQENRPDPGCGCGGRCRGR